MEETMEEQGFAIRCPHCFEWTELSLTPDQVAIRSAQELRNILKRLQSDPDHFISPKLLRCARPSWACPAPFEAFVFRSESDAMQFAQISEAWSVKAGFRLYKLDRVNRWDGYTGVLVCTCPVPRQKDVLLERLFDRELLRRSLTGMAMEINAPLTVYAADTPEVDGKSTTVWVPIEAYPREAGNIPPRYNPFCKLCRTIELSSPLNQLPYHASPDDCPLNMATKHTCGGRNASCISKDWNRCPAFLDARAKKSLCYASDRAFIQKVESQWTAGEVPTCYENSCWAGLKEFAFPIVVHDVLIGVAMTGQFLLEGESMPDVDVLIKQHPSLATSRMNLTRLREVLLGARPQTEEEELSATFRVTQQATQEVVAALAENVTRIASTATARYRMWRSRSEMIFKQELLGRIEGHRDHTTFVENDLPTILRRLREFWGFRSAYLVYGERSNKTTMVLAQSTEIGEQTYVEPRKIIGSLNVDWRHGHSFPVLLDLDRPPTDGDPARELLKSALADQELAIPKGRFCLGVFLPLEERSLGIVFVARDLQTASPLATRIREGVSDICQEAILDTCTDIMHRLCDVPDFRSKTCA